MSLLNHRLVVQCKHWPPPPPPPLIKTSFASLAHGNWRLAHVSGKPSLVLKSVFSIFCNLSTWSTSNRWNSTKLCVWNQYKVHKHFRKTNPVCHIYYIILAIQWMSVCCLRAEVWVNAFSHLSHLCGFSPLCFSLCLLRSPLWANCLLHISHVCGFSLLCIKRCHLRYHAWVNRFSQMSHPCFCFPCVL